MATQGFLSVTVPDNCVEPLAKLGSNRKDELVKKCVHAFVVLGQEGHAIKKSDLGRLVFSQVTNYRAVNGIIHLANDELQDVFGMRLYYSDDKSQAKFFLVNTSLSFEQFRPTRTSEDNEERTYLHFSLMEIFISAENRSTLDDLKKALKFFDRDELPKDHLKTMLDRFVKQLFLSTTKDKEIMFFVWGPRAFAEIDLDKFFLAFMKLSKENNQEAWPDLVKRLENMKKLQQLVSIGNSDL